MRVVSSVGCLYVESRSLKQGLGPICDDAMDRIKSVLRELASSAAAQQIQHYEACNEVVNSRPKKLGDFTAHLQKVKDIKDEGLKLQMETAGIDEMYRILKSGNVKLTSKEAVQIDDLHKVADHFKASVKKADNYVRDQKPGMATTIDESIEKLEERVEEMRQDLLGGQYTDADADPDVVTADLDSIKEKLAHMKEQGEMFNRSQSLLNLPEHPIEGLRDTETMLTLREEVWGKRVEWEDKHHTWQTSNFSDIDIELVEREVNVMFKDSFKLHKRVGDEVTDKHKTLVGEFRKHMATLMDLGNPNMMDTHWREVFTALKQPYDDGMSFCLEELISYGVLDDPDMVGEASARASGEFALRTSLNKILNGTYKLLILLIPPAKYGDASVWG